MKKLVANRVLRGLSQGIRLDRKLHSGCGYVVSMVMNNSLWVLAVYIIIIFLGLTMCQTNICIDRTCSDVIEIHEKSNVYKNQMSNHHLSSHC